MEHSIYLGFLLVLGSGAIWDYLKVSVAIWSHLEPSEAICAHLEATQPSTTQLESSAAHLQPIKCWFLRERISH